ncbi:MAG: glycosyltransferase [Flavobacterium sp.]|nr:glycosyltransferase [Flavobacterium sp.]
MIYFFATILFIYILSISWLIFGIDNIKVSSTKLHNPRTSFTIIVPFRNEGDNFLALLDSISSMNYPSNLFEIIVVDDDSDDQSVQIFNDWQINNPVINSILLSNNRKSNSPKKDAIDNAISKSKHNWIITTDADCVVNKNWLLAFDNCIQNQCVEMVVGAVSTNDRQGLLNYFQFLDVLSLQGTTIGSFGIKHPFMCNGANFAYTKKIFIELNGFSGNDKISSGDDVFLLQKAVNSFQEKVIYLKNEDAIVYTKPEKNWSNLFNQRVRWASKTNSYDSFFGKFLAVTVLSMNFCTIISFWFLRLELSISIFILKYLTDYFLLYKTNKFINPEKYILPVFSSLIYPFFCISVAFYSFFGTFEWKKRISRK